MPMLRHLWRRWRLTPEQAEQHALRRIREHFAAFGYDLSDMTDDELRAGVRYACEVIASSGIPMREASDNLAHAMSGLDSSADLRRVHLRELPNGDLDFGADG